MGLNFSPVEVTGLEPRNLTVPELAPWDCRFIVTDDRPFLYCGHHVKRGSSYCPVHHRIVYERPAR